jgi:hypothetical protein
MTPTAIGSMKPSVKPPFGALGVVMRLLIISRHLRVFLKTAQPKVAGGIQAFRLLEFTSR